MPVGHRDRLVQRLNGHKDRRSALIVKKIAEEETAHVAVGVYWHSKIWEALEVDPAEAFRSQVLDLGAVELLKVGAGRRRRGATHILINQSAF